MTCFSWSKIENRHFVSVSFEAISPPVTSERLHLCFGITVEPREKSNALGLAHTHYIYKLKKCPQRQANRTLSWREAVLFASYLEDHHHHMATDLFVIMSFKK